MEQDAEESRAREAQAANRGLSSGGGGLPLYIDPLDFQQIEARVTAACQGSKANRDFKNLFSVFLLQACSGLQLQDRNDKRIPFTFIQ